MLSATLKKGYRLIDSGDGRKLESVGPYVLDRPEPLAEYRPALSLDEWKELRHAIYQEGNGKKQGKWECVKEMAKEWSVELQSERIELNAHCSIEGSKQFGFFPEQSVNWDFLQDRIPRMQKKPAPKALMLFAYTGLSSIVAKASGADTFHVDSAKSTITRARKNMEANHLSDIRWVAEDAMKFVQRELRRGKRYQIIVMDPPSFGRGPDGELWKAEEGFGELLDSCTQLLDPDEQLMILNLYAKGTGMKEIGKELNNFAKEQGAELDLQELYIPSHEGNGIPAGATARSEKIKSPDAAIEASR